MVILMVIRPIFFDFHGDLSIYGGKKVVFMNILMVSMVIRPIFFW